MRITFLAVLNAAQRNHKSAGAYFKIEKGACFFQQNQEKSGMYFFVNMD